uniref:MHC class I antigen n=1 Tax=Plectus sambesii TaxID=2011161 RepID=A0A914VTM8_9BILA
MRPSTTPFIETAAVRARKGTAVPLATPPGRCIINLVHGRERIPDHYCFRVGGPPALARPTTDWNAANDEGGVGEEGEEGGWARNLIDALLRVGQE